MRKVIYIGAGVAIASVNVINAGCCGSGKDDVKKIGDIEITLNGEECKKVDDDIKKNFEGMTEGFGAFFKFAADDISKNVSIFNYPIKGGESGTAVDILIFVGNDEIVNRQDEKSKKVIKKLGDSGYHVCCVLEVNMVPNPLKENEFSVEEVKDKKGKFDIKFDKSDLEKIGKGGMPGVPGFKRPEHPSKKGFRRPPIKGRVIDVEPRIDLGPTV